MSDENKNDEVTVTTQPPEQAQPFVKFTILDEAAGTFRIESNIGNGDPRLLLDKINPMIEQVRRMGAVAEINAQRILTPGPQNANGLNFLKGHRRG